MIEEAETRFHAMVHDLRAQDINLEYKIMHGDWVPRRHNDVENCGYGLITSDSGVENTAYIAVSKALDKFWRGAGRLRHVATSRAIVDRESRGELK